MPKTLSPAKKIEIAAAKTALLDQLEAFENDDLSDAQLAKIDKFAQHYSERNAMLIVMQCPKAREIHGYGDWQKAGRQVRKGSSGIRILAPCGQAKGEEATAATSEVPAKDGKPGRRFFKLISVFDISQTDKIE